MQLLFLLWNLVCLLPGRGKRAWTASSVLAKHSRFTPCTCWINNFLQIINSFQQQGSHLKFTASRVAMRLLRRNDPFQQHSKHSVGLFQQKWELTWEHLFTGTRDFVACNHLRSYKYYSDSIVYPDGFLGYTCSSYDDFQVSMFQCLTMGRFKSSALVNTSETLFILAFTQWVHM